MCDRISVVIIHSESQQIGKTILLGELSSDICTIYEIKIYINKIKLSFIFSVKN